VAVATDQRSPSPLRRNTPAAAGPASDGSTLRRLARDYLKPQWPRIGLAIVCMLIVAGATGLTAWLLEPAIRTIFVEHDHRMLMLIPLAILMVSAVKAAAAYGQGVLVADISRRLVVRLQKQLFHALMYSDLARLDADHSGTQLSHFLQNVGTVGTSMSTSLIGAFRDVPTMLSLIVVMFVMDWRLALVAVIAAPMIAVLTRQLSKVAGKSMRATISSTAEFAKRITEALQGIRIVKAYGREPMEIERTGSLIDQRMRHFFRAQRASLAAAPLTEALAGIGIAAVIFYGGTRVMAGTLQQSQFFTFLTSMVMAFQPMRTLSGLSAQIAQGRSAAHSLFAEIDIAPAVADAPNAKALALASRAGAHVRFEDVSFDYGREVPALSHVSLEAKAGETVALVGPSGAGKTTILNLLLRFYDVAGGRITIDGQDIRSITLSSLREGIALVAQDATLFDDTIAANIAYGGEGDVEAAARLAAADDFITSFPQGYETRAGEAGLQLSGGEKQRIAIARAFLKNAPILLLDEATSALDSRSEARVQEALSKLMKGRTTFVIAHRLSTILAADRIYVLSEGKVRESGTHSELIRRSGLYASLYKSQFRAGESADGAGTLARV